MIHIKRFIDKVSMMESRQNKDVVMPMTDARGLRDELAKILADHYSNDRQTNMVDSVIKVEVKGGSFK